MSDYKFLQLEQRAGCATVWLNRPERHNAFHEGLVAELSSCVAQLSQDAAVRAIVLAGRGRNFCAGADLTWMQPTTMPISRTRAAWRGCCAHWRNRPSRP